MWIILWDPFLMKKLLKSDFCGSVNSAQVHCSRKKSTFTAKKKKTKVENINAFSVLSKPHLYCRLWVRLDPRTRLTTMFYPFCFLACVSGGLWLLFMNSSCKCWLSTVNSIFVHCLRTHKYHFLTIFSLKMDFPVLFTHLKIIL